MSNVVSLMLRIEQLEADMKEVLDRTGISYERWKELRPEEASVFMMQRIEYHREQGFGFIDARNKASAELREKFSKEKFEGTKP